MLKETKEIWRDIQGFEGLYQISSLGRIRSLDRKVMYSTKKTGNKFVRIDKGRILKARIKSNGYLQACLYPSNGKPVYRHIHRLVAETFLEKGNNYEVNHLDHDKQNNKIENLEWSNRSKNKSWDAMAGIHNTAKLNPTDIINIRNQYKSGIKIMPISRQYKVHHSTIKNILIGKTWKFV